MKGQPLGGFDYRTGEAFTCDRKALAELVAKIEQAGATHRRIAGDMTYFDKHGHMVIELYESTQGHTNGQIQLC